MENRSSNLDALKWVIVGLLLTAGFVANYYLGHIALPLRLIGWIVIFGLALFMAAQTGKGRVALDFARESRVELRKVVWPTRQETVQTTLVVVGIVLLVSIVLWATDSILLRVIGILTGQRG